MGQKVHPHGFRVGFMKDWDTRWVASRKDIAAYIKEDDMLRKHLKKKLYLAGISRIEIERNTQRVTVNIHAGKPGIIIGKGGQGVELIKKEVEKLTKKSCNINIIEVKNVDADAQLVAENIASQLERRISFRL